MTQNYAGCASDRFPMFLFSSHPRIEHDYHSAKMDPDFVFEWPFLLKVIQPGLVATNLLDVQICWSLVRCKDRLRFRCTRAKEVLFWKGSGMMNSFRSCISCWGFGFGYSIWIPSLSLSLYLSLSYSQFTITLSPSVLFTLEWKRHHSSFCRSFSGTGRVHCGPFRIKLSMFLVRTKKPQVGNLANILV